ncbi:MAG: hypothetical protein CMO40_03755 [Verrucomicrobiaceae bacterium]|nr:hypothetical protein [Verrucomicrobiaceae bacterium]
MSQDKISFTCPSCGVRLRVPVSLAGVKGPCPSCSRPIEAPLANHPIEPEPLAGKASAELSDATPGSAPDPPPNPRPDPDVVPIANTTTPVEHRSSVSAPASAVSSRSSDSAIPDAHSHVPFAELPVPFPDHSTATPASAVPGPRKEPHLFSDLSAPAARTDPPGPLPDLREESSMGQASQDTPTPAGFPEAAPLSDPFAPSPSLTPSEEAPSTTSGLGEPLERITPHGPSLEPPGEEAVDLSPSSQPSGDDLTLWSGSPSSAPDHFMELGINPASALQEGRTSFTPLTLSPPPGTNPTTPLTQQEEPLDKRLPTLGNLESDTKEPGRHDPALVKPEPPSGSPTKESHPGYSETNARSEQPILAAATTLSAGLTPAAEPGEPDPQNTLPLHDQVSTGQLDLEDMEDAHPKTGRKRLSWPGVLFPILFVVLAAIMVFLVLDLSELLPHSKRYENLPQVPQGNPEPVNARQVPESDPVAEASHEVTPAETSPTPAPGPEAPSSPAASPPAGTNLLIEEIDRAVEGEVALPPLIDLNPSRNSLPEQKDAPPEPGEALSLFLGATSLEERRPYMTRSRRSEAELARGPLSQKLPSTLRQRILPYVKNSSNADTAHFFEVSFDRDQDGPRVPILVQVSEGEDGRMVVHSDAFLDLYNDELAQFGAVPVKGERTFHAVADAYKRCFEEKIPESATKSFIKLRQHEQITPRLLAYFEQTSAVSAKISQSKGLLWGRSGICTVTVKWNTDHPGRPFVELVGLDSLSWEP